jgi:predicted RNA-binding Zn-ribbon protein involved in translation (DUF1610 family)
VKTSITAGLVTAFLVLTGCVHYERTYVRVVGADYKPLALAKVTASLYDPIHLDLHRTHTSEVLTKRDGLAKIKIPMCSTRGVDGGYVYSGSRFVGRGDPNDDVGPELIVTKEGYGASIIYRSNNHWKNEDTSRESPFVVDLIRTRTEPDGPANRSQPIRSETNSPSPSAVEQAEGMACTSCGGRFAWVGRSDAQDVFECQDCGEQVPHQPMTTVRMMPHIPLYGTMTDTEAVELRKRALKLRPDMSAEQIEATMGLARFATCSSIATNASGRIEVSYATEPDVFIVLTGKHRHVAPQIYVIIDRWRARFETNGWRVVE